MAAYSESLAFRLGRGGLLAWRSSARPVRSASPWSPCWAERPPASRYRA